MPRKPSPPVDIHGVDLEPTNTTNEQEVATDPEAVCVSQEEFDRAVKHLSNQISEIHENYEQRIVDLETLVGAFSGGKSPAAPPPEYPRAAAPEPQVPWYQSPFDA